MGNKDEVSIQRLFRIQGGIFPNRSKEYLKVVNNKLVCSANRSIHIGDSEHMTHFLFKRLGITQIEDMPKEAKEYNIHVIEMYVPYWLTYLLEKYSVDEFENKDKTYPKLVDKTTPGQSYQIFRCWSQLLEASCIFAQDNRIATEKDIYNLILPGNLSRVYKNVKTLDINSISDLIYRCKIRESDIYKLRNLWHLDIARDRGGK